MTLTIDHPAYEAELFAQSLRDRGLGDTSRKAYTTDVARFYEWAAVTPPVHDSLDAEMRDWIASLRGQVSSATLHRYLSSCKSYLRFRKLSTEAVDEYRMPPRSTNTHCRPLPGGVPTLRRLIASINDPSLRIAVALGGFAGLRVSEMVSVTAENIDWQASEIVVLGKGEKARTLPISAELADVLRAAPKSGVLVPMTNAAARFAIARATEQIELTGISSHDLRATFATTVYRKTRDIMLVSRLLGHASVTTTQRYLGLDVEHAHSAVDFS